MDILKNICKQMKYLVHCSGRNSSTSAVMIGIKDLDNCLIW